MKILKLVLVLLLIITKCGLYAQTPEEYAKQRAEKLKALQEKQQSGVQALRSDIQQYQDERDKEYAEYLKQRWTKFQVFRGISPPSDPKPPAPPAYDPSKDPVDEEVDVKPDLHNKPEPEAPANPLPLSDEIEEPVVPVPDLNSDDIRFMFFGASISIPTDKEILLPFKSSITEENIAQYWDRVTSAGYQESVNKLIQYSGQLNLNDWAYYLLVDAYAKEIHQADEVSSQLLSWVMLIKSGYKVRIGYSGNQVSLLLPCPQQLYSKSFLSFGGVKYYITKSLNTSIYTYDRDFEGATRVIKAGFDQALNLPLKKRTRELTYTYGNREYKFSIDYNQNLIDFYDQCPQMELQYYFNAPVSEVTASSIKRQFKQALVGNDEEEMAEMLLEFMHKAFAYQTDQQQFGREKWFFVEDVFAYRYCDCEDRSVLYTYMVRNLVDLKTIGLNAPGHVFTAVDFQRDFGDNINYQNKNYTICDPTYMGAKIGNGMPDMMDKKIVVIPND